VLEERDEAWHRPLFLHHLICDLHSAICNNRIVPVTDFPALPSDARLWVFAADRVLTAGERERLLSAVDAFLAQWKAHGHPLTVAREWKYDRFLLVGVDEASAGASGCSIDAMLRTLSELERALQVQLLDHGPVLFRRGDAIERLPRPQFAQLAKAGEVSPDTVVFNNTVTRVGELREGRWETPARESWHAKAFGLGAAG
jgi:hypothetical protein